MSEYDFGFSGAGGGYTPVILSEAERHIEDLKDNLHSCKQKQISVFNIKEIIKNMKDIREIKYTIKNHKSIFPEYYL